MATSLLSQTRKGTKSQNFNCNAQGEAGGRDFVAEVAAAAESLGGVDVLLLGDRCRDHLQGSMPRGMSHWLREPVLIRCWYCRCWHASVCSLALPHLTKRHLSSRLLLHNC